MLTPFGPEIWTADGGPVSTIGFRYPTRMTVIRLPGGSLFVCSPVGLTNDLRDAVDALGEVRYLIVPNSLHHLYVGDWKRAYPDAEIHAAPRSRDKLKDLVVADDLGDRPSPAWSAEIDQVVVRGNAITTEVVFFHWQSRTVIFTDLIQQFPAGWFSGWRAVVAKWDLMLGREPSVPRKFRIAFVDRAAGRESLRRVLAWPADKVLMAHGLPLNDGGQAFLGRAFSWLI